MAGLNAMRTKRNLMLHLIFECNALGGSNRKILLLLLLWLAPDASPSYFIGGL
jgi:hypothetical protein